MKAHDCSTTRLTVSMPPIVPPLESGVARAMNLVQSALCFNLRERVGVSSPQEWDKGTDLLDSDDPEEQRLGVIYLLRALVSTPNAAQELAQQMLHDLDIMPRR